MKPKIVVAALATAALVAPAAHASASRTLPIHHAVTLAKRRGHVAVPVVVGQPLVIVTGAPLVATAADDNAAPSEPWISDDPNDC